MVLRNLSPNNAVWHQNFETKVKRKDEIFLVVIRKGSLKGTDEKQKGR